MGQPAVGDLSRRTATTIRALRTQRGITHVELSRRLAEAGRPIPVVGLSRIENHKRRLDVDDVAAIAAALGVDPGQLVFDGESSCVVCRNQPPAGFTCTVCTATADVPAA